MKIDLTDPQSIAAWYEVRPKRHGPMLKLWRRCPIFMAFWPAIDAARELVVKK